MTITVKHIDKETRGAFVALAEGSELAGEMTYSRSNERLIIIDHTETEPAYAGQGVGKLIVEAAIAWAVQEGIKIIPLCPFAKRYFEKNADAVAEVAVTVK